MRRRILIAIALIFLCSQGIHAQTPVNPTANWVSVKDFGAKGDGQTDDSAAILKAFQAAGSRGITGGNVVYFPPSSDAYVVGTPLTLTNTFNTWITLYFDSALFLKATLSLEKGGIRLLGNSGGEINSFSKNALSLISVFPEANPGIHISGNGIRLENIDVANASGDGIVVENAANVYLKDTFAGVGTFNLTGIPLIINGNFGFYVDGGGFSAGPEGTAPSIEFTGNGQCNFQGIVRIEHTFLANNGISVNANCEGLNSMTFEDILYESGKTAFLTLASTSTIGMWSYRLADVNMSDSQGSPKPALIDAHCQSTPRCVGIFGVHVVNSSSEGPLTTGDPISDLEIWSPDPRASNKIAQSKGYVLHTPGGIYNAMPTFQVGNTAGFAISANTATETVKAGQTAAYPMSLSASGGSQQTVSLSCTGAPSASTCSVSPSSITTTSNANFTATITTTAPSKSVVTYPSRFTIRFSSSELMNFGLISLMCFGLVILQSKLRYLRAQPLMVRESFLFFMLVAFLVSGCAEVVAGKSPVAAGTPTQGQMTGTPAGTYTLEITGTSVTTSGTVEVSTPVKLVVQ